MLSWLLEPVQRGQLVLTRALVPDLSKVQGSSPGQTIVEDWYFGAPHLSGRDKTRTYLSTVIASLYVGVSRIQIHTIRCGNRIRARPIKGLTSEAFVLRHFALP